MGITIVGGYFNDDSAFDTKEARKVCFHHGLIPNIDENKRLFNKMIYNKRFSSERRFAWIDKFCALRVRDDRKDVNFLGEHHIAFAMINLRHLFHH